MTNVDPLRATPFPTADDAPPAQRAPAGRWRVLAGSMLLRLALGSLLLTLGTIALTTWLLINDAEGETEAREEQRALAEVTRSADILSRRVLEYQRSLTVTAAGLDTAQLDRPDGWRSVLAQQPLLLSNFYRVLLARPDGHLLGYSDHLGLHPFEADLSSRPYFQATVREARPVISPALLDRISYDPVVVLAQPVLRQGRVVAVLLGTLRLNTPDLLTDLTERRNTETGAEDAAELLVVTDAQGHVLAHPAPERVMQSLNLEPRMAEAYRTWHEQGRPVEPAGLSWRLSSEQVTAVGVPGADWMVWRAYSRAAMLSPLQELRRRALFWASVVAVGATLVQLAYLAWQLSPLRRLQRRVLALLDGEQNPAQGWPQAWGDLGRLSDTLREVALSLARQEGESRRLFEQLKGVMAAAPLGLGFVRGGRLDMVNAELARLVDYTPEALQGLRPELLLASPEDAQRFLAETGAAFAAGQPYVGEWQVLRRNGSVFWGQIHARAVGADLRRSGVVWTLSDISAQVQSRHRLEWSATHDALTGLLNRRGFEDRLQAVVQASPARDAALLLIDLDHFKPINDRLGHPAGDAVLQAVARALSENIRQTDAAGRIGGDEFAVLLEGCPPEQVDILALKLLAAIEQARVSWQGEWLGVGASIGSASWGPALQGVAGWVHEADQACYAAKRGGRGRVSGHAEGVTMA